MKFPGEEAAEPQAPADRVVVAAVVAGYFLLSRELGHLDLQELLEDFSNTLGAWTYLLVGVFAFVETGAFVGLVVPGETVMLLGGAVAGQGAINIYLLIAIAWFSAWAGTRPASSSAAVSAGTSCFATAPGSGSATSASSRSRTTSPATAARRSSSVASSASSAPSPPSSPAAPGMRYRAFVPYSILGTGLWASLHILVGYFFSRSIESAAQYAGRGLSCSASTIVVVVGIVFARPPFPGRAEPARSGPWMERHVATRWMVILARRFRPQLLFLWERVTPGGTFGLEFTTLMAILAVAGFVLVAYTVIVSGDPGPTPGDTTAIDVVESLSRLAGRHRQGLHRPRLRGRRRLAGLR